MNTITKVNFDDPNQVTGLTSAKGDIITGNASSGLISTTVGADNTILTADSTQAGGVAWTAPATVLYNTSTNININGYSDLTTINWTYNNNAKKYTSNNSGIYSIVYQNVNDVKSAILVNCEGSNRANDTQITTLEELSSGDSVSIITDNDYSQIQQLGPNVTDSLTPQFATTVSLNNDGTIAAVGIPFNNSEIGVVAIYTLNGTWQLSNIIGTETGGKFGNSISLNGTGDKLVIGEPNSNNNSGAAYVFTGTNGCFSLQQKLVSSDITDGDEFGYSVAISNDGNYIIVGARSKNNAGTNRGSAYVFTESMGVWSQQQILVPTTPEDGAEFGFSVSIDNNGTRSIVGARLEDVTPPIPDPTFGNASNRGAAYIFTRSVSTWTEEERLVAINDGSLLGPFSSENGQFGFSVSIDNNGDNVVIGSPNAVYNVSDSATDPGAAWVFNRSVTTWTSVAILYDAADPPNAEDTGYSVSISNDGTRIIIGDPLETSGLGFSFDGAAYVFTESMGTWTLQQKIVASDAQSNDQFGTSVAISGDGLTIICGAPFEDAVGTDAGAAYISTESMGTWTQQQKITPISLVPTISIFGFDICMNRCGTRMITGDYSDNEAATNSGAFYVFDYQSDQWLFKSVTRLSPGVANAGLGVSCAINDAGTVCVIGAYTEPNGSGNNYGAAYVYNIDDCGSTTLVQKLVSPNMDINPGNYNYGRCVTINGIGNLIAIGERYVPINTANQPEYMNIYSFDGMTWNLDQTITSPVTTSSGYGLDITMNNAGTIIAVSGYTDDDAGSNAGAAYVYTVNSMGVWSQQQKIIGNDTVSGDRFGIDVKLSGDGKILAIGADQDDDVNNNTGSVYIFKEPNGSGTGWVQNQKIIGGSQFANQNKRLGRVIGLDYTGYRLVVGESGQDDSGVDRGRIRIYEGFDNTYVETQNFTGPTDNGQLGIGVWISSCGNKIAAGASGTASNGCNVFAYNISDTTQSVKVIKH